MKSRSPDSPNAPSIDKKISQQSSGVVSEQFEEDGRSRVFSYG